ncbi:MAG: aminotransferase class I/II-fold pyridoxal phosphate-dependent enzyme [Minwuia sp.]|uniref:aminotransferase class I/II-fold pyridoxal phosphate-dependent enzyme n=1 Tax=Minwuia sp. TaxID=2493630 RepID=UPI003A85A8D6
MSTPSDTPTVAPIEALTGNLREYKEPQGIDLLGRTEGFFQWQELRRQHDLWPYSRSADEAPRACSTALDDTGRSISGVNFASQDYLSLSSHPAVIEAAKAAMDEFGVHSAGSAALLGNTPYSLKLERELASFMGMENVTLYPTGWSAGYAAIQGLVRPNDHVVMDVLAHSCMQQGAIAATTNIHLYGHLNTGGVRRKLRAIRAKDKTNGIMVVTESLFSMHADTPDLSELHEICREYDATLLVDVAHDMGCIGEDGLGHLSLQKMLDKVDLVVGSFSKSFASNGGFIASNSRAVKEYLKYYSAPQTFSNALSPVQAAIVLTTLGIIRSPEGRELRRTLMDNILYLREQLNRAHIEVLGDPCPIVPARIGAEAMARIAMKYLGKLGAIVNLVEYPAVQRNGSRIRLQVMAKHSRDDIDNLTASLRKAIDLAEIEYRRSNLGRPQPKPAATESQTAKGEERAA